MLAVCLYFLVGDHWVCHSPPACCHQGHVLVSVDDSTRVTASDVHLLQGKKTNQQQTTTSFGSMNNIIHTQIPLFSPSLGIITIIIIDCDGSFRVRVSHILISPNQPIIAPHDDLAAVHSAHRPVITRQSLGTTSSRLGSSPDSRPSLSRPRPNPPSHF